MSLDLSAAVEAAAQAHLMTVAQRNDYREPLRWDDLNPIQQHALREHVLPYVTAAAPQIEAAVRAQASAEILQGENWTPRGPFSCYGCPVCADMWESEATCTHWAAIQWAARVAGGADL